MIDKNLRTFFPASERTPTETERKIYMIKLLLTGCNGRMGKAIVRATAESGVYDIVAGVDLRQDTETYTRGSFPVFERLTDVAVRADVIIDFSHHSLTEALLTYAEEQQMPVVIATTGHTDEEKAIISRASKKIPVFYSRNMSLGINLLIELVRQATKMLGPDFDIEIIEKHHNQKLDAPSGTALMLADAISEVTSFLPEYIYERESRREKRGKNEIGIHSVRAGTIVGEHEVIFAGHDEMIALSHSAASREVFARGALRAAGYLFDKKPGLYDMQSLVSDQMEKSI